MAALSLSARGLVGLSGRPVRADLLGDRYGKDVFGLDGAGGGGAGAKRNWRTASAVDYAAAGVGVRHGGLLADAAGRVRTGMAGGDSDGGYHQQRTGEAEGGGSTGADHYTGKLEFDALACRPPRDVCELAVCGHRRMA